MGRKAYPANIFTLVHQLQKQVDALQVTARRTSARVSRTYPVPVTFAPVSPAAWRPIVTVEGVEPREEIWRAVTYDYRENVNVRVLVDTDDTTEAIVDLYDVDRGVVLAEAYAIAGSTSELRLDGPLVDVSGMRTLAVRGGLVIGATAKVQVLTAFTLDS
jgi:hypothetical protein